MNYRHQLSATDVCMRRLPSGRFKNFATGVPDYHMMDWRGCNVHGLALPGQPHRGFQTAREALNWLFANFPTQELAVKWANACGMGGTWISSYEFTGSIDWKKRTVRFDKPDKRGGSVLDFVEQAGDE